jgi:hypothetical protein
LPGSGFTHPFISNFNNKDAVFPMGKPLAIAMLSKLSQETDLRLSKMAFPLHQVQRTSFLDPRADGFGLPAHPFDKILRTGNQLGFLTADQIVTALMKGIAHLAREGKKAPDCIGRQSWR